MKGDFFKKTGRYIIKNPGLPLSASMLAISGSNLKLNLKESKKQKEEAERNNRLQIKTLDKLNKTLKKVDSTLKSSTNDKNFSKMIKFREKKFGIRSNTVKGALLGSQVGLLASKFVPKRLKIGNVSDDNLRSLIITAGSTLLGAALGAISGIAEKTENKLSKPRRQLMNQVVSDLKKTGFKSDYDFTLSPKLADEMKTRVCVVISRSNEDLKILINTISDRKLQDLVDNVIKNIPNSSVSTKQTSSRYNEISITKFSDSSADAGLVSGLCTQFIRSGYPVYLIEIG